MGYTQTINISLGRSRTGFSLGARLLDSAGNVVGNEIVEGFSEIGQGHYLLTYTEFPDGFRGAIKFYNRADSSVVLAVASINPEAIEYVNNLNERVEIPKQISIDSPNIVSSGGSISVTTGASRSSEGNIEIRTGVG